MIDGLFILAIFAVVLTAFTVKDLFAQARAKGDDAS